MKFSREPRGELSHSSSQYVPGPGSYAAAEKDFTRSSGPKYTCALRNGRLGGKPADSGNASSSPGPGAYNLKGAIGNEGPKVLISGRPGTAGNAAASTLGPGPGSYMPGDVKSKAPSYRLGTAQRGREDREAQLVPGPGSYNPADNVARGGTSGWG